MFSVTTKKHYYVIQFKANKFLKNAIMSNDECTGFFDVAPLLLLSVTVSAHIADGSS